jgi:predicted DNA-binding transcriptional regulator YafY
MSAWLRNLVLLQAIPRYPQRKGTRALCQELANKGFDVSQRTVQRDLIALSKLLPDLASDGNLDAAGWFWKKDSALISLPTLDPALALAFKLSESYLRPQLPAAVLAPLNPYFRAANQVLKAADNPSFRLWPDRVRFLPKGQPLIPAKVAPEILGTIEDALFNQRKFKGRYQALGRDLAEYEFNPLGLVYQGAVIYLVATVWDYEDSRHYALHRFKAAWPMEEAAKALDNFSLEEHIKDGRFEYPEGDIIKLVADFSNEVAVYLEETPLSEDQQMEPLADGTEWTRVTASVRDTQQLRWWLLSWGDRVILIRPEAMAAEIASIINRQSTYYAAMTERTTNK